MSLLSFRLVFLINFVFMLPACSEEVRLHENSSVLPKVISLNPCLDALLIELAEPSQILALSHYSFDVSSSSIDLTLTKEFRSSAGTVEEIIALNPDVVFLSTLTPASKLAGIRDLGISVEAFNSPRTVAESIAQVRRFSSILGRAEAGEVLVQKIDEALSLGNKKRLFSAVMWQPGGIVPDEGQLISELLKAGGFISTSTSMGFGQGDSLGLEQILYNPPDVVFIAGSTRAQRHPSLEQLDVSVRQLDPSLIYCGGTTIPKVMTQLNEIYESLL